MFERYRLTLEYRLYCRRFSIARSTGQRYLPSARQHVVRPDASTHPADLHHSPVVQSLAYQLLVGMKKTDSRYPTHWILSPSGHVLQSKTHSSDHQPGLFSKRAGLGSPCRTLRYLVRSIEWIDELEGPCEWVYVTHCVSFRTSIGSISTSLLMGFSDRRQMRINRVSLQTKHHFFWPNNSRRFVVWVHNVMSSNCISSCVYACRNSRVVVLLYHQYVAMRWCLALTLLTIPSCRPLSFPPSASSISLTSKDSIQQVNNRCLAVYATRTVTLDVRV